MMTAIFNNPFLFSLMCGVIGFVYVFPLTEPGQILSSWYKTLERLFVPRFEWLFNIIVGCERCFTGQFSLWTWLWFHRLDYQYASGFDQWSRLIFIHIFVILSSILIVIIIQRLYVLCKR